MKGLDEYAQQTEVCISICNGACDQYFLIYFQYTSYSPRYNTVRNYPYIFVIDFYERCIVPGTTTLTSKCNGYVPCGAFAKSYVSTF